MRNVNDTPDSTIGGSLLSRPVENASLQETHTKLIEDMAALAIVLAMEWVAAGLKMSTKLLVVQDTKSP